MLLNNDYRSNESMRDVYDRTDIVRKPICGIVSGYHDLPYIMVAPAVEDGNRTVEVTGRICVSPKFVISMDSFSDTFGDVFDPETFDCAIEGRIFSFASGRGAEAGPGGRNVKVESRDFTMQRFDDSPGDYLERVSDLLMSREDTRTGLIFSPDFRYYPVSIDKFISEIVDREFRA